MVENGEMLSAGRIGSVSGDDVAYLRALVDDFPLAKAAEAVAESSFD